MRKAIALQKYFRDINFSPLKSVGRTIPYTKQRNNSTKTISH